MPSGPESVERAIEAACERTTAWLRGLPSWRNHPSNASGSVSSHFGPTILSEHDCVMQFARHLHASGLPWEDMHLEFSPGQWMFNLLEPTQRPKRIDLAVALRERLTKATFPTDLGSFQLDAVIEFALASDYWKFGAGSKRTITSKITRDIDKVAQYLRSGLATLGYVVVIEEVDHDFPDNWSDDVDATSGVRTRVLRRWIEPSS
jgi:hypothetical protein